jgi:DNA-binding transcriptional MerR regulator
MSHQYTVMTSRLANDADVTSPTIRTYADLGLLDFIESSNGVRLFREGQAGRVREIYEARMRNRGRRSA